MAYWWVSQNKTYRQERSGGYMWAPKRDTIGKELHHWSNMTRVRPGDVIFSYANQCIGSVGVAVSPAYDAIQPAELGGGWEDDGWCINVEYQPLRPPIPLSTFVDELFPLLPQRYSPLTAQKTGNQGYLFGLPPEAGRLIAERVGNAGTIDEVVEEIIERRVADKTEREALVKSRIGQGRWRKDLLRYWSGKCAVTGLAVEPLLRASHIKPWRDSDNRERLDVFNGLLLGAAYDAAFDAGLITFEADGKIIISKALDGEQRDVAGLSTNALLRLASDQHREYLSYHRASIFKQAQ